MPSAWLQGLARRVPSSCQVCGDWPATAVCEACIERFAQPRLRCLRCAMPVPTGVFTCARCAARPPPLDACHAAVDYAFPWSGLIQRFKFRAEPAWAARFAELLRAAPWVEPALEQADCVLPMPLAPGRLSTRGFNQAWELARRLAPRQAEPQLLLRLRETTPQSGLARADRTRNLGGAMALDPGLAGRVRGADVVVVDDVMTSGASLHAAARVLRAGGAARITGLALARTDVSGEFRDEFPQHATQAPSGAAPAD